MTEQTDILQEKWLPLDKMTKEQLTEECETWRKLFTWLDPKVKYFLTKVGEQVALLRRDYHRYVGTLLSTKWTLQEIEIGVYEKVYDHNTGKYFFEKKVVIQPLSQIIGIDFILEREPVIEEAKPAQI